MSGKINVETLVQRNKDIAANHEPIPTFGEMIAAGVGLPQLLIITCADPRSDPKNYLGVRSGEGVLVVRNVCGHVAPALESILALDAVVTLSEIMVVHHTDCGALQFTNQGVRDGLKARVPGRAEVDGLTFGAITDVPKSVEDDLAVLKSSPFIRKELAGKTSGFVYDIKTGLLTPIEG